MQPRRKRVSGAVPGKILSKQKDLRRLSLALCKTLPAVGLLKTATAEVSVGAAAVVAGVAMDVATGAETDASGDRSRVLPGLWLKVFLHPLPHILR